MGLYIGVSFSGREKSLYSVVACLHFGYRKSEKLQSASLNTMQWVLLLFFNFMELQVCLQFCIWVTLMDVLGCMQLMHGCRLGMPARALLPLNHLDPETE